MAVNIVTGRKGEDHITSDDERARNAEIFGKGKFVFDFGTQFLPSRETATTLRIYDGMLINQGTQIAIELNDSELLEVDNGTANTYRNDLVVMRYTRDYAENVESAELVVIKGTPAPTNPQDPAYITGNILDGGDDTDDMPLYRVRMKDLSIYSIEKLWTDQPSNMITGDTIDILWGTTLPDGDTRGY